MILILAQTGKLTLATGENKNNNKKIFPERSNFEKKHTYRMHIHDYIIFIMF